MIGKTFGERVRAISTCTWLGLLCAFGWLFSELWFHDPLPVVTLWAIKTFGWLILGKLYEMESR